MTQEQQIPPFGWFANQFTFESREEFIKRISHHLKPLLKPGAHVLDLCCGAGPITLSFEELGAEQVTGIDFAPFLIDLARQEAIKRGSNAKFLQANVLTHPLGSTKYDLVTCFGNPILDFPHEKITQFRDRIFNALKPGGHFIIEHIDGLMRVIQMSEPKEVIEDGFDSQIVRSFKEYDPVIGAYKMEYKHLSSGETYEYTGYVYTGPLIQVIFKERFELEQSIRLNEVSFMDVYIKR
jgi:2-polyprenyl-3-methyl-5-hydroxy-6-metoxy-1,4-benzoquinol methylase